MSTRAGYAGAHRCPGAARDQLGAAPRLGRRAAGDESGRTGRARPPSIRASEELRTVTTEKQRRQAAQRHLQKQLERRAEQTRKRKRTVAVVATVVSVLVVVGAVLLMAGVFEDDEPATSPQAAGTVSCTYAPDESGNASLTEVGT